MSTLAARQPANLPPVVNRRIREASEYARRKQHMLRGNADPVTFALYQILTARQTSRTESSRAFVRVDQDVVRALEIHEDQHSLQAQLEAYLLTALSFDEIGARINESPHIVELYARAFFSVRPATGEPSVPLAEVVGAYKTVPSDRLVMEYFWKLVALLKGGDALDDLMAPVQVSTMQDAAAASANEAKLIAQHKIAEAAMAIDPSNPGALAELRHLLTNLPDAEPNDAYQHLLQQIDAVCTSIAFSVGKPDPNTTWPELRPYQESAVELNPDEELRIIAGQQLPNAAQLLNARFPSGPDDHAALSISQCEVAVPLGADEMPAEPIVEMSQVVGVLSTNPTRISPAKEVAFKRKLVAKAREQVVAEQARREAARQAVQSPPAEGDSEAEALMHSLDLQWEAFAGDTTGAARNRQWLKFKQQYPHYVRLDARRNLNQKTRK